MKILYISQYFPPEIGATQSRAYEMARNLIKLGHQVTVMTEVPNHPSGIIPSEYRGKFIAKENYDGIPVIRSWVDARPEKTFHSRMRFYLSFMVTTVVNSFFLRQGRFDAVFATSPPLFVGMAGLAIAHIRHIPFFFEVRDLWPESAVDLGQLSNPKYIAYGHAVADLCYRQARGIVAVTRGILLRLERKGIPKEKLFLIKNGTNPERFHYIYDPSMEEKLGWRNKFVVLYAGIHGVAQGLETVLEAAEHLKMHPSIHFAFIGEGPVKERLVAEAAKKRLSNVQFLAEVSSDEIPRYISLASVCLVPLKKLALFDGALPSKIFDCWGCGKPLLVSVDGEARSEVEAAGGGIFVEPENANAMSEAIWALQQRPELCREMGEAGRHYLKIGGYIRSEQAAMLSGVIQGMGIPALLESIPDNAPLQERKLNILRIISRINIGGPAIHVHFLTKGLNPERFKTLLAAGRVSTLEGDMGYLFESTAHSIISIPELGREIRLQDDIKGIFRLVHLLRKNPMDIVHTHTSKAGFCGRIAVFLHNLFSKKKILTVHTFHGNVFDGYFGSLTSRAFIWIERLLAKGTDAIIAISQSQAEELVEKFRIALPHKIRTIPLGFDLTPFENNGHRKGAFRKSLGIGHDVLLVGIVGRLAPIKNHRMFLLGAQQFISKNPNLAVMFLIVGDGELRTKLQAYCHELGIEDKVRFCGWIKDIPSVYADLDILTLTSRNEGTPVSVIEAMAASVPVIATEVGGVVDLIGPYANPPKAGNFEICTRGLLCRKDDVAGFTQGIKHLATMDRSKCHEMVDRAHAYTVQTYSLNRLLKDTESLYLQLSTIQICFPPQ